MGLSTKNFSPGGPFGYPKPDDARFSDMNARDIFLRNLFSAKLLGNDGVYTPELRVSATIATGVPTAVPTSYNVVKNYEVANGVIATLPAISGLIKVQSRGRYSISSGSVYDQSFAHETFLLLYGDGGPVTIQGISQLNHAGKEYIFAIEEAGGDFTFTHEDAAATAADRIIVPGGESLIMPPTEMGLLVYDDYTSRWRISKLSGLWGQTNYTP